MALTVRWLILKINFGLKTYNPYKLSKNSKAQSDPKDKIIIPPPQGKGKIFKSAEEVICDIPGGSTLLIGGFGLCGIPENLINALVNQGTKNLIVISNNVGTDDFGIGKLIKKHQIKRIVASYIGENDSLKRQYLAGELELELTPEGTLAERIRAGGAGIPAFYAPAGLGTIIQEGMFVSKYNTNGNPEESNEAKQTHEFNGKDYVLENSITGDFALIKAWKADTAGNLIFNKSARNFNPVMCKAAKISIAEVEEIVPIGNIDPDNVHLPGIYVDRIIKGQHYEKRIEKLHEKESKEKSDNESTREPRDRIIKRAALEIKEGMYVNLGVGLPILAFNQIPKNNNVTLQSEIGILGLGPVPEEDCWEVNPDLINASKQPVTILPGASFFESEESFAMIRGGHIDLTILEAMQVSHLGDLANWMIPEKLITGMGANMDLVSSEFTKVVVAMNHISKDGKPTIVNECTLPITGQQCVDLIITDLCVFKVIKGEGLKLIEIAPNVDISEIFGNTECEFEIADELKEMRSASKDRNLQKCPNRQSHRQEQKANKINKVSSSEASS